MFVENLNRILSLLIYFFMVGTFIFTVVLYVVYKTRESKKNRPFFMLHGSQKEPLPPKTILNVQHVQSSQTQNVNAR